VGPIPMGATSRLSLVTCFIRGGTTGKSCEGLVGPIPMGATSRLSLVTCFIHGGTTGSPVRD
jgi:hypothetical protein